MVEMMDIVKKGDELLGIQAGDETPWSNGSKGNVSHREESRERHKEIKENEWEGPDSNPRCSRSEQVDGCGILGVHEPW